MILVTEIVTEMMTEVMIKVTMMMMTGGEAQLAKTPKDNTESNFDSKVYLLQY